MKRTTICAVALVLFSPWGQSTLSAQDTPTVFLHGVASSGATWEEAAARLADRVAIDKHIMDLSWQQLYETQAAQVQARFGSLPGTTIGMGHSNGGVIHRQWSRTHPLSAIITIGTPHRGVPLLQNFAAYGQLNFALVDSISSIFSLFENSSGSDWADLLNDIGQIISFARLASNSSFYGVASALGLNAAYPIIPQMFVESSFLMALNSQANVAREAAQIPTRVGIVSTAHNFDWGGPLRAWRPERGDDYAQWRDDAEIAMEYAAILIWAIADPTDDFADEFANRLWKAASYLGAMDDWWLRAVSVVGMRARWQNDTVIPVWTQDYSPMGATLIWTGIEGPAHTQEKQQGDEWLFDALTRLAHVPPR